MDKARIQSVLSEIDSIAETTLITPIQPDAPQDFYAIQAVNLGRLAAVQDVLKAILREL